MRRIAFVLAATDTGPMIVNRLDFDPVLHCGVAIEILEFGNHNINEIVACGQLLGGLRQTRGDGVIVIDGGANIGTHTIAWAAEMLGWGQVIAVEPQERTYYALCGNIALNNCSNGRAIKAVLGRQTGEMDIPEYDHEKEANFGGIVMDAACDVGQKPRGTVKCRVWAIDDLIEDLDLPGLDFLKLDIEGMEPAALHGAREAIACYKPIIQAEHQVCGIESIKQHLDGYELIMAGINVICIHQSDPVLKMIRVGPPPVHPQHPPLILNGS